MIQLGDECKDTPSGFVGICTGIAIYMGGGVKLLLEARTPTGDPKERWVSESRVEVAQETPSIGFACPPSSS